jgi:RimJ/RimL family protein N-acetyltransferase
MNKQHNLIDGTPVVVRQLVIEDLEKSRDFFKSLTLEDRLYLRVDVLDEAVVEKRIKNSGLSRIQRIVAEIDGQIVADAGFERRTHGWERHLADFRLIVAPQFRRKGLGMIMAEELYELAVKENVEEMVARFMVPQTAVRKIFERLGFEDDVVLKDFVKDINGQKQDLVIMRGTLDHLWDKLEEYFHEEEHRNMCFECH